MAIQCVNCECWCLPLFPILQSGNLLACRITEANLPRDWVFKSTYNKYSDKNIGVDWIQHFDRCTILRTKDIYGMLVLDGHQSYGSAAFKEFCQDSKIITIGFPLQSSLIIKLLDVGCFGPLNLAYGRAIEDFTNAHITHITKPEFLMAFKAAHFAAITKKKIQWVF